MSRAILADKLYIRAEDVSLKLVKKEFSHRVYNEAQCVKCDNRPQRFNYVCSTCPAYKQQIILWNKVDIKDREYISVPSGDIEQVKKKLRIPLKRIKDMRPDVPFRYPVKFTGNLYEGQKVNGAPTANQVDIVAKFLEHEGGQLSAAPRSGKCLTGATLVSTNQGLMQLNELIKKEGYSYVKNLTIASMRGNAKVSHTYKSKSKVVRIKTEHGFELGGTPEHKVKIIKPNLTIAWRRLDKLQIGDYIIRNTKQSSYLWPTEDKISLPIARILGYLTANGSRSTMFSGDPVVISSFTKNVKSAFNVKCRLVWNNEVASIYFSSRKGKARHLYQYIEDTYNFSGRGSANKCIPLPVRQSSKAVMKAFLSSYFACDSGINGKTIEISSASKKLMQQIHIILHQAFHIRGNLITFMQMATNYNSPTLREYYKIELSGNEVEKFIKEFPKAKASRTLAFSLSDPTNQWDTKGDYVPYISNALASMIGKLDYRANKYYYKDEIIPKSWPKLYRLKAKATMTRALINNTDWPTLLDSLAKIDPIATKRTARIIRDQHEYEKVTEILKTDEVVDVYDVTVPSHHEFTANGLASHNTVMGTAIFCHYGQRTLILVKSDDLARQFLADIYKVTNLHRIERKLGRPIAIIAKKDIDFSRRHDIVVCNYQKFIHKVTGRPRLRKYLVGKFGTVIIDEVHNASALAFSAVINSLDCRHKIGLSATTTRKDMLHLIVGIPIVGPVRVESDSVSIIPEVRIIETGLGPKTEPKAYPTIMRWLSESKERNKQIVRLVFKILRSEEHRCILIPIVRVDHAELLAKMINRQAQVNNNKRGEDWNTKRLALPYHAKVPREQTLNYAKKGVGTRVIVGMRPMVGEFLSIPPWTDLIHSFLFSNEEKTYQLVMRICTTAQGKAQPIIWTFVDKMGFSTGCFMTTFLQTYVKRKYIMSNETRKLGYSLIASKKRFTNNSITLDTDDPMNDTRSIGLW